MDNYGSRAFALLEKINFIRVSGSPEETRAAEILADTVRSIGLKPSIEEFQVQYGDIQTVCLEACGKEWEATGFRRSGSTPPEGLLAPFAYVQDASELDLVNAKGKIVLLNGGITEDVFKRLIKAEVAAFITFSGTVVDERDKTDLNEPALRDWALRHGRLPGVHLRTADALELARCAPEAVRLTLIQEEKELTSRNVIAEIPGTGSSKETVIFGAHFDSVPFSHGVYDNGAGSVILMELLRYFASNPPRRNLRFIWFGSEEVGLLGSKAYTKAHEEELDSVPLMINVDVAGPVLGKDSAAVTGDISLCHMVEYLSKEIGFPIAVKQDIYSSDSIPFANLGVPGINFCRFGAPGAALIHCRNDVIDYLGYKNLQNTIEFILTFAQRTVNAVLFPVPKEMPQNMVEAIDKYLKKTAQEKKEDEKKRNEKQQDNK